MELNKISTDMYSNGVHCLVRSLTVVLYILVAICLVLNLYFINCYIHNCFLIICVPLKPFIHVTVGKGCLEYRL